MLAWILAALIGAVCGMGVVILMLMAVIAVLLGVKNQIGGDK